MCSAPSWPAYTLAGLAAGVAGLINSGQTLHGQRAGRSDLHAELDCCRGAGWRGARWWGGALSGNAGRRVRHLGDPERAAVLRRQQLLQGPGAGFHPARRRCARLPSGFCACATAWIACEHAAGSHPPWKAPRSQQTPGCARRRSGRSIVVHAEPRLSVPYLLIAILLAAAAIRAPGFVSPGNLTAAVGAGFLPGHHRRWADAGDPHRRHRLSVAWNLNLSAILLTQLSTQMPVTAPRSSRWVPPRWSG